MDSGIGAGVDSYFEYLVKGGIMFSNSKLIDMFHGEFMNEFIIRNLSEKGLDQTSFVQ